jgi:hypothetical protein
MKIKWFSGPLRYREGVGGHVTHIATLRPEAHAPPIVTDRG